MPNTVKRNYPYPALQGEPPNIPLALENLANAIETDLENVTAQIPAGTVNELESRAALMEGRLSNLERHQVRTGRQTISDLSSSTITVPESTFLYGIEELSVSGYGINDYGNCTFGVSASLYKSSNTINLSLSAGNARRWSATIVYAYYA